MWPIQCATYPLAAPINRFAQKILFQFYWHAQIFPAKFYLTHTIRFMEQLNTIPPGLDLITCNLKENLDRPPFPFEQGEMVFMIRVLCSKLEFTAGGGNFDLQQQERTGRQMRTNVKGSPDPKYCRSQLF